MRGAERAGPAATELVTGSKISVAATGVHAFAVESKISAAFVAAAPTNPPATKTRPSASTVAECPLRGMLICGAGINVPVVSKNSASVDGPAPLTPPVMNIRPSCNNWDRKSMAAGNRQTNTYWKLSTYGTREISNSGLRHHHSLTENK